jgi:hypothetical protein
MSVATNVLHSLHAPLLLATTDIDINVTFSSSSHDPNDILLYDFDRQVFLEVMLVYAAPMAAALVVRHSAHAACPMTRWSVSYQASRLTQLLICALCPSCLPPGRLYRIVPKPLPIRLDPLLVAARLAGLCARRR